MSRRKKSDVQYRTKLRHWLPKLLKRDLVTVGHTIYVAGRNLPMVGLWDELDVIIDQEEEGVVRYFARRLYGFLRNR